MTQYVLFAFARKGKNACCKTPTETEIRFVTTPFKGLFAKLFAPLIVSHTRKVPVPFSSLYVPRLLLRVGNAGEKGNGQKANKIFIQTSTYIYNKCTIHTYTHTHTHTRTHTLSLSESSNNLLLVCDTHITDPAETRHRHSP